MEKKYLPIGTVCTLKGKTKKVMITGYYSISFNGNIKISDYCGCTYPEGELLSEQRYNFNHTDIEKIDFMGYQNEESKKFQRNFNTVVGNVNEEDVDINYEKPIDMILTSNKVYSKLLFDENGVVMIAEPVKSSNEIKKNKLDIEFDKDGYVISTSDESVVDNPFKKEYKSPVIEEKSPTQWKIFDDIEFDENGVVVAENTKQLDNTTLSNIEFDENGVVIAINSESIKNNKYIFDENGVIISEN